MALLQAEARGTDVSRQFRMVALAKELLIPGRIAGWQEKNFLDGKGGMVKRSSLFSVTGKLANFHPSVVVGH